jgi:hypothetical protein
MAEFKTVGEVGVALAGLRSEVAGSLSFLKWALGGVAAVGLVLAGWIAGKIDAVEETATRAATILERLEPAVASVAANTETIVAGVASIQAQPGPEPAPDGQAVAQAPSPALIEGWRGFSLEALGNMEAVFLAAEEAGGDFDRAWVFVPISN